ncbi:MAG: SDR family oxidoreductase [Bacteroidetes bacterium]|nr:MAG: SDR family oxidoreductase [Bacteroidota bacterium]
MVNKVVIITGGTSGIGKALAKKFALEGSKVVVTGRNLDALNNMVAELKTKNLEVLGVQADVSIESDNARMVEIVMKRYGRIDVLINNAGISMRALFEDLDLEVIRKVMDINFYGAVYATKYCLPEILKTEGTVVGISSVAGTRGVPARTGYSASKFALNGFLEVLRTEMLYKNVNVLTVCPGFVSSNIRNNSLTKDGSKQGESPRDEKTMMSSEECAKRVYEAVVKRKKLIYPAGFLERITVTLNKFFPIFMDKMVYNVMAKEANSPFEKK